MFFNAKWFADVADKNVKCLLHHLCFWIYIRTIQNCMCEKLFESHKSTKNLKTPLKISFIYGYQLVQLKTTVDNIYLWAKEESCKFDQKAACVSVTNLINKSLN